MGIGGVRIGVIPGIGIGKISVKEYALKFHQLSWYALGMVSSMRDRMRKFAFGLSTDLILEIKAALSIKDMDISSLVMYLQQERVLLWEDLKLVVANAQMPTLCMGDFNAMIKIIDILNGSPIQEGEMKDFVDFLVDTHMTELKTVGRDYTWTNDHTYSRIDHTLVNVEYMIHESMLEVMILTPGISDHSPLSKELGGEIRSSSNTFRFFNYLVEHP
ncbi:hypothetical protein BC332_13528 [Capsicum chinense]|nr:hypothetical protein BC332_13528 [Capsicum chinense]